MTAPCVVCGLGALFIAKVLKVNEIDVVYSGCTPYNRDDLIAYLHDTFSLDELQDIEDAFELYGMYAYLPIKDPPDRLRDIMSSVLTHGKFDKNLYMRDYYPEYSPVGI